MWPAAAGESQRGTVDRGGGAVCVEAGTRHVAASPGMPVATRRGRAQGQILPRSLQKEGGPVMPGFRISVCGSSHGKRRPRRDIWAGEGAYCLAALEHIGPLLPQGLCTGRALCLRLLALGFAWPAPSSPLGLCANVPQTSASSSLCPIVVFSPVAPTACLHACSRAVVALGVARLTQRPPRRRMEAGTEAGAQHRSLDEGNWGNRSPCRGRPRCISGAAVSAPGSVTADRR